ncbi:MAG TPA: 2-phosphosulfolactate phosphatase [Trueperaceae bacterium]|nr:2-phosphosulfolactate phosphatase [Trueperaceae bacterium]
MAAAGNAPLVLQVAVDLLPDPGRAAGSVAVVVDVLRMTTTATVLADLGLAHLTVVADLEQARERARQGGALLLGERDARPPDGFDAGNSPAQLTAALVRGRAAVMSTTNGSAAVEACADADAVLLGCLRNGAAAARRAGELARGGAGGGRVRVVCAGTEGRVSLDDIAGAGHIVAALARLAPNAELDDAAQAARTVAAEPDLPRLLAGSYHGRRLLAQGFHDDVLLAAQRDASSSLMERIAGSRDGFRPHSVR